MDHGNRNLVRWMCGVCLMLCVCMSSQAMTLERDGSTLFATGPVEDDFGKFKNALEVPGLEQIVFVNSPGGDLWTGMRVGRIIANSGVKTVTAGKCVSACSIMFMGGRERTFADAFRANVTYVGIHGPSSKTTKAVTSEHAPQIYAFFKMAMGERFNADLMNKAFYDMDDAGSMLRVFDVARTPKRVTYHCRSQQTPRRECTEFPEADALSIGLITNTVLTKVSLPASMQSVPKILGTDLDTPIADKLEFLNAIAAKSCVSDSCKTLVQNYANLKEHSAIVTAVDAQGVGTTSDKDSPNQAALAALFACSHIKDRPVRLCTLVGVNEFDVQPNVVAARASHESALALLVVPVDKFYGNEQFGGGFTSATGLRTERFTDATPSKAEGIQVVGTQDLVMAMKSVQPPVLIDVSGLEDVVPGSSALLFGGIAYADAAKDTPLEQRIVRLLKLLAPDPQRAVVFIGSNRDDWRGLNAAFRARKAGYAQVAWYRGGMAAWKSASLPQARIIVNAVAN
jgi:hypothetical protein